MIPNALWSRGATEIAQMIRAGEISALEAVESSLARIQSANATLNAVAITLLEEAKAEAKDADARLRSGQPLGPLHGVPVAVKINVDQRGQPNDNGVVAFKNTVATLDNPVVANLRDAGAIIVGRTNSPPFAMRWATDNALHGRTLNPWSRKHVPGGSSGGAAAAVASGMCSIAHGNDIAGSVRYPAFCCGVFGLRPSYGRIPAFNPSSPAPVPIASQLMAVQGPLTRNVADLRLAARVMGRSHSLDPRSVNGLAVPPTRPLRVALMPTPGTGAVHPAISATIRSIGRQLEQEGLIVEEIAAPNFDDVAGLWPDIAMPDYIAQLEPLIEEYGDDGIRAGVGLWRACWPQRDPAICLRALSERLRLLRLWLQFMEVYPVLIMPTSRQLAFEHGDDVRDKATTAGIISSQTPMTAISVLGLPAISAPTGLHEGIPLGVQIVAGPFQEDLCADVAEVIERRNPMPAPPDAY
jgi:amidase